MTQKVKKGSEALVNEIPPCDFCKDGTEALYDGKTTYGSWANMCQRHFRAFGLGIGTGLGQKLIKRER